MEKDVMAKVTGIVKRNGMFDKARKDILEKVLKDEGMQTIKQQCEQLVRDVFNRGRGRTRGEMRQDLRRRMQTGVVATDVLNDFVDECLKSDGLAPDTLEGIARAEHCLPPLNTNTDVVDMELSDGASPADTASTKSTEIPINHAPEERVNGRKTSSASSTLTEASGNGSGKEGSGSFAVPDESRSSTPHDRSRASTSRGDSRSSVAHEGSRKNSPRDDRSGGSTPPPANSRYTSPSTATYKDSTPSPLSSPRTPPDAPSPAHSACSSYEEAESIRSPSPSPELGEPSAIPGDDLLEGAEAVTPVSSDDSNHA